jgi:hypothetical protein
MATDSWQKYLEEKHDAFAVNPMKSASGFQLLDVLVNGQEGLKSHPLQCWLNGQSWIPEDSQTLTFAAQVIILNIICNHGK